MGLEGFWRDKSIYFSVLLPFCGDARSGGELALSSFRKDDERVERAAEPPRLYIGSQRHCLRSTSN
jgi:hypothetical protein